MAGVQSGTGQQGQASPPAWHPDPYGGASHRWWDGTVWTDQIGPAEPQYELQPMTKALDKNLFLDQRAYLSGNDFLSSPQGEHFGVLNKQFVGDVTAHSAQGSWVFDRRGITQEQLEIRVLPANAPIAQFAWYGGIGTGREGILTFTDQRWFRFVLTEETQSREQFDSRWKVLPEPGWRRIPSGGAWSFFAPGETTGLVTSRLTWPIAGRLLFPGDITVDVPVTVSTYGTNNTSAEVTTDVYETLEGRREAPLLVMLSTFLVWWYALVRESRARHRSSGGPDLFD